MNSECWKFVKYYVEVKFEKELNISPADMTWRTAGTQDGWCLAHWVFLGYPKAEGDVAGAHVQGPA